MSVKGHPTHVHSTEYGRGGNLASQSSVQGAGEGLSLFTVQGKGPALFGRDWLAS